MGATKQLFMQDREQEISQEDENVETVKDQPNSELFELIGKLQRKEIKLSYSSLKEFGKSPMNFIRYKLKQRKPQTESQIFGSLCDCLITEPERFDQLFVVNDVMPTTDNQKGFCQDLINGLNKENAFSNNYSRGKVDDLYNQFLNYVEATKSGKTVITKSLKEEAENIIENLKKSDLVMQYLDSCNKFQNKLEWKKNGWDFIGYSDCSGDGLIIDLKFTRDANPDKFERDVVNYEYYMQMGMYADASNYEGVPECYFIAYDKTGNFSVIKLDYGFIKYGIRKYKYLLSKLDKCISENRFNESYNFFDDHQRTVYRPKWIKAVNDGVEE